MFIRVKFIYSVKSCKISKNNKSDKITIYDLLIILYEI